MAKKIYTENVAPLDPTFTGMNESDYSSETLGLALANATGGSQPTLDRNSATALDYLRLRGGVNRQGFYGDSFNSKIHLTDDEHYAVMLKAKQEGTDPYGAVLAAVNAKRAKNGFNADGSPMSSSTATADGDDGDDSDGDGGYSGNAKTFTAPDGRIFTDITSYNNYLVTKKQEEKTAAGKSAYDILFEEFKRYGLESLAEEVKGYIVEGLSPAEFSLRLQRSPDYQKRFSANKARIDKGLRSLSAAEYIGIEDQYQDTMRRYGLPESYYTKGFLGVQEGFTKLIENDVSNVELEDRIMTAQKRVINTNPEVSLALKQFYPDITNSDILAYSLDPKNAIENIKRKVTSAEIGGAAIQAGLQTGLSKAEQLQGYGVTKESAQQGYGVIAGGLQRGSQLASIYGESPYTQTTAEQEVFNIPGSLESKKQRQKITGLEKATFGGQTGITSSALARDRAGGY